MLYEEELTGQIIGAAIEMHREIGPGLLESAYEACLCYEFELRQIPYARQIVLPLLYKSRRVDCGYRADVIVADKVVIEVKAVETVTDLHKAQLLTYLRITGKKVGLILNFNTVVLIDGIVRQLFIGFYTLRVLCASVVHSFRELL
jgi:GxxExxY protein